MSDTAKKSGVPLRRTLVRAGLVLVYAALIVLVFIGGKGHTLIIDNKDVADAGLTAFSLAKVTIDGQKPSDYVKGDRDKATLMGQRHKVTIEVPGQPKIVKSFTVPFDSDIMVLSLPRIANDKPPYLEVFVAPEYVQQSRDQETFTSAGPGEATSPETQMTITPSP